MLKSRPVIAAVVLVVGLAMAVAGCSSEEPLPRPITEDEADLLSEVFFTNYENGGSDFVLNALLPDGSTVVMTGEVDFVGGAGIAGVSATGPDAAVTEVAWGGDQVLERMPEVSAISEAAGQGPIDYVAHLADPEQRSLDSLIAVVAALASESRENPLLLQQNGVELERHDILAGTPVDVFLYGDRTRLWVQTGTSTLKRFEGNNAPGTRPVLVDLSGPGARELTLPAGAVVVDESQLEDLFADAG